MTKGRTGGREPGTTEAPFSVMKGRYSHPRSFWFTPRRSSGARRTSPLNDSVPAPSTGAREVAKRSWEEIRGLPSLVVERRGSERRGGVSRERRASTCGAPHGFASRPPDQVSARVQRAKRGVRARPGGPRSGAVVGRTRAAGAVGHPSPARLERHGDLASKRLFSPVPRSLARPTSSPAPRSQPAAPGPDCPSSRTTGSTARHHGSFALSNSSSTFEGSPEIGKVVSRPAWNPR